MSEAPLPFKTTYIVTYTYDNPSGAGPFKGRMTTDLKCTKGESISAMFGRATVVSCRQVKPA